MSASSKVVAWFEIPSVDFDRAVCEREAEAMNALHAARATAPILSADARGAIARFDE